ncbi:hypothetical protein OSTOST_21705 [Ostertagia ostertagi]
MKTALVLLRGSEGIRRENEDPHGGGEEYVTKLIDYLPEAFKKFSEIVEDENQTPRQIGERRHNLTATYPEAFHVLKFAFGQFMPRHGPSWSTMVTWRVPWHHGKAAR